MISRKCRIDAIRNYRKAKLPTGLVPNWQLKVQLKQSLKVKANAAETSTLGGLEDDDTSAEILVSKRPSQKNNMSRVPMSSGNLLT
jgi:hypothetical protein